MPNAISGWFGTRPQRRFAKLFVGFRYECVKQLSCVVMTQQGCGLSGVERDEIISTLLDGCRSQRADEPALCRVWRDLAWFARCPLGKVAADRPRQSTGKGSGQHCLAC
jgi:hypothetical protein